MLEDATRAGAGPLDLEAEYNNRARVPDYPEIMAGWEVAAGIYRAERRGRCELGLRYGPHPRQVIDVFHPDRPDETRRLVVFFHGGYWRSLEPRLFSHFAEGANRLGLSMALPGYRLCPEVGVLDVIADARDACLDLDRRFRRKMVACGHSAGGHLAAAMAATDWSAAGAPSDLIRAAQAISGIFDLAPLLATSVNETLGLDEAAALAASPAFWPVPDGAALEAWVGETESSEYFRQARSIAERWGAAGAKTRVEVLAGLNHFTAPEPLADPESSLTRALAALASQSLAPEPRLDPSPRLP